MIRMVWGRVELGKCHSWCQETQAEYGVCQHSTPECAAGAVLHKPSGGSICTFFTRGESGQKSRAS